MSLASWPKMLLSEKEGWSELARIHPSVSKLFLFFVMPMSLIPSVMYVYSELLYPGVVFPLVEPMLSLREAMLVGGTFFVMELALVLLMAVFIRQVAESVGLPSEYEHAFTLAAIAPAPLWLSALALFIPSLWANVLLVALAWVASVALIRHGIRPLFGLSDEKMAHRMANAVTVIGVLAWIILMLMLSMLLSLVLGWR